MPVSPRSKGRSTSKGRGGAATSTKKKTPAKKAVAAAPDMEFEEGDSVMARWPGTTLFFKSKVTYVRDDDNEYDVLFEDGTVYTLKAKEVKKKVSKANTGIRTPSRSRSRGRSPGRPKGSTTQAAKSPNTSVTRRSSRSSAAFTAPRPDVTPTRQSARIAARVDAVSDDDETHGTKASPNPSHSRSDKSGGKLGSLFRNCSFEWIGALFMMALFPLILVSLHTLCTKTTCKPTLPFDKLPKTLAGYWDPQAFTAVVGFAIVLRILSFLPVGSLVKTASGNQVRMNGFLGLLTLLAIMPALVYRKIDLSMVRTKYFYLMTASLVFAAFLSLVARLVAHFAPGKKAFVNPKGNTGNFIVDFFNGREFNPSLFGHDLKLQTFRFSMMGLAMINVAMTIDDIMKRGGQVNPVVVMASAFQVLYALDSMFFEEYYFFSHDAMNTGYGFSLVSSYNSFPFLPTLITKYLIDRQPVLPWYYLVAIGMMNALGYIIFRASETQRCEFAKDPNSAAVKHLETLPTAGGRKLLTSGWWGLVRHPNYLGEILIQWSWVMPAVRAAGRADLLVYYLPIFTTLVLLMRCRQQNVRNSKKYGLAWRTYCDKVTANLIPKVY
jgi:hypothetical protein